VHLVDASHPDWREQLKVGEEVLASLGVDPKSCIVVLNKADRLDGALPPAPVDRNVVAISALTGEGIEALRTEIRAALLEQPAMETLRFPADGGEELQRALREETVVARRFTEDGIELVVRRR